MGETDLIDELVDQWRLARPDLPDDIFDALATIGRLVRIGTVLAPLLERAFVDQGIGRGEYEVLAALRRLGEPFTATPSAMARLLMLSPGAMTNRLDRLEAVDYLRRAHDPDNRRSVLVTLTPAGRTAADTALEAHLANSKKLLSTINASDRRRLDSSLRRLLTVLAEET